MAVSVKSVLDTPLLTDDGCLTESSSKLFDKQISVLKQKPQKQLESK